MTIDGFEFSDLITDNPVKIGYQVVGGVDHHCYVQSTSSTQIKCRMATDFTRSHGEAELIVFASTSEEATFANGVYKFFYFQDDAQLSSLTGLSTNFDTTTNKYSLTFTGSGFKTVSSPANDETTVDVLIGGIAQTVTSVTDTEVVVQIDSLTGGDSSNTIEFYLAEGVPAGFNVPVFTNGITFQPKLVGLSTNLGSAAGSTIYAYIEGAGTADTMMLRDGTGYDLCETATMLSYGLLECVTKPVAYDTVINVKVQGSASTSYPCANPDTTACQYKTISLAANIPEYTSVTLNADGINFTITGTNLNT